MFTKLSTAVAMSFLLALPASAKDAKLSDPEIAHIAYTAGNIDIKAAQLAKQKSKNEAVLQFADEMERDHKEVNRQALDLLGRLNVGPKDNPVSQSLTSGADKKYTELEKLEGAAFDRAYIQNEVSYHETVNGALQKTLIPGATNKDLKDLLKTGLKIFKGHEEHARHALHDVKSES